MTWKLQAAAVVGLAVVLALAGQAVTIRKLRSDLAAAQNRITGLETALRDCGAANARWENEYKRLQASQADALAYCKEREDALNRQIRRYVEALRQRPATAPAQVGGRTCGPDDVSHRLNCLLGSETDGCRP